MSGSEQADNMHPPDESVPDQRSRLRAMRKAGDVDGLIRELGNPAEEEGVFLRGEEHHDTVRAAAAVELARLRDPRTVGPISALLGDQRSSVRALTANALGKMGDPAASVPVLGVLGDEKRSVRSCAARSLGRLRDPVAVEGLVATLADEHPGVRREAALALRRIGDRRAIGALKGAVRRESWRHPIVRVGMVRALLRLLLRGRTVAEAE